MIIEPVFKLCFGRSYESEIVKMLNLQYNECRSRNVSGIFNLIEFLARVQIEKKSN